MKIARYALVIAALVGSLAPAFAATYRTRAYRPHAPARITIYPAHPGYIDFSRYIDPLNGMYCRNTGWAAECVPPSAYARGLDCVAAWPYLVCRHF